MQFTGFNIGFSSIKSMQMLAWRIVGVMYTYLKWIHEVIEVKIGLVCVNNFFMCKKMIPAKGLNIYKWKSFQGHKILQVTYF